MRHPQGRKYPPSGAGGFPRIGECPAERKNVRLHSILGQDSNNSSHPPSTDQKPSKKKANEYNGRQFSGKKTCGQKGHSGTTLSKRTVEEKIRSGEFCHTVENRVNGEPVTGKLPDTDYISHYVIHLKILAEAKEMIKSLAVDLYSEGNASLNRIRERIVSLSGQAITISEGSIFHFLKQFADLGGPVSNRSKWNF